MIDDAIAAAGACLSRIESLNETLGAFVHVDRDGALAAAAASAARRRNGVRLSPLDGIPVGVKANIAVQGLPFHGGIGAYRDRLAAADAVCVARLRDGGAVILGLLNMDEGALGALTDNAVFGRTHNPWRHGYTAGGSSGGAAAAVAADMCVAALCTDTLGSVRIPASYCGVFGYKPRAGMISTAGSMPLAAGLDQVGILARRPETVFKLLAWLSPRPIRLRLPAGPIGVLDVRGDIDLDPEIAIALTRAAAKAAANGCTVRSFRLQGYEFKRVRRAAMLVMARAAADYHASALAKNQAGFSLGFRKLLNWATTRPENELPAARALLAQHSEDIVAACSDYEVVLAPTTPATAFAFGSPSPPSQADLTAIASLSGLAAVSFPCGFDAAGMPIGLTVMGGGDAVCLALSGMLSTGCSTPA